MITRTNNSEELIETTAEVYPELLEDALFEAGPWLSDLSNIALTDGKGSFGLFTYEYPGVYSAHYFFKVSGKEALDLAMDMLTEMFVNRQAEAIRGLVPSERMDVRWMTRQLGFTSYGEVDTNVGPCIIYICSLDEFFAHKGKKRNG